MKYFISALLGLTLWNSEDDKLSDLGTAITAASVGAYLIKEA